MRLQRRVLYSLAKKLGTEYRPKQAEFIHKLPKREMNGGVTVAITGKLGNYTVHLGSAVVHKQPGGSLCIIPVHSQHRGRVFLPFADQDPKSAEVVSKVILLAKDSEIRDPTILEQILN